MSGKDVVSSFRIRFTTAANDPLPATAIAGLLVDKRSNKWRELFVNNVDGVQARTYVGKGVAPRASRLAGASKRLARSVAESLGGDHNSWYRPYDGKLVVDGIPSARVECVKSEDGSLSEGHKVAWIEGPTKELDRFGFGHQSVTDAFEARENQTWTS